MLACPFCEFRSICSRAGIFPSCLLPPAVLCVGVVDHLHTNLLKSQDQIYSGRHKRFVVKRFSGSSDPTAAGTSCQDIHTKTFQRTMTGVLRSMRKALWNVYGSVFGQGSWRPRDNRSISLQFIPLCQARSGLPRELMMSLHCRLRGATDGVVAASRLLRHVAHDPRAHLRILCRRFGRSSGHQQMYEKDEESSKSVGLFRTFCVDCSGRVLLV